MQETAGFVPSNLGKACRVGLDMLAAKLGDGTSNAVGGHLSLTLYTHNVLT